MRTRRRTTPIRVGDVIVGGDAPVSVQSMAKTDTRDIESTTRQINDLGNAGCQIVRLAVPDLEAASALGAIRNRVAVPIVADIHFDYRLAIAAIGAGVAALRLNPGNISRREHLRKIVSRARERDIPIRIGVNSGSLPHDYRSGERLAERMVSVAMEQVHMLEEMDFHLIKVSLKAPDVLTTVEAYRLIADRIPYPLHMGVTGAGPPFTGAVRSTLGIGLLLSMGIGDTIRVSLSGDPGLEVDAGREILGSLHLIDPGASVISCPTCGRTSLDIPGIASRVSGRLRSVRQPIRVAIMGCVVNGPGECRDADVGIAGGDNKVLVYRAGVFSHSVPPQDAYDAISAEIDLLLGIRSNETPQDTR